MIRIWRIQDKNTEENLYLVHHTEDADMNVYDFMRGVIIDLKLRAVVSRGRLASPIVTTNELKITEGVLHLIDENKQEYKLNKFSVERGYESTTLYIWKHNGNIYFSTNKTINARSSKWGKSQTFEEIYTELGGPDPNLFFPEESRYSNRTYEFLIVHKDLLNVTKLPIDSGFIVFVGVKMNWETNSEEFKDIVDQFIDTEIRIVEGTDKLYLNSKTPFIHTPSDLTIEDANHHLRYGFYEKQDFSMIDTRLTPGEFLIVFSFDEKGKINKIIKVQSEAYKWRSELRNQNANLKYRLFELLTKSYSSNSEHPEDVYDRFTDEFPVMGHKEIVELTKLLKSGPIIIYPQDKDYTTQRFLSMLEKREQRFYNIFLCFLMVVPLCFQEYVISLYQELNKDRAELIEWIKKIDREHISLEDERFHRVKNIITEARKQANYTFDHPNSYTKGQSIQFIFSKNIYSFIMKERGDSLYKLVRLMNVIKSQQRGTGNDNIHDEISKLEIARNSKIN